MSKEPFLQQVAQHYYQMLGGAISQKTFVFPSKRALQFFRHYLSRLADIPIFAPRCITVNDFITSLLPERRVLDRTALIFELYRSYTAVRSDRPLESFDEFVYWGGIILKDFDLIDRYLVSARELYTNVSDFKELQDDFSYMEEETLEILRGFWRGFEGQAPIGAAQLESTSSSRERFLDFWLSLYPLYEHFGNQLATRSCAYEGALYRAIAEQAVDLVDRLAEDSSYVFVGLFDITPSEFRIFRALRSRGYAEFCWDEQVHILSDEQHKAHKMMLRNKEFLGSVRGGWDRSVRTLPHVVEVISCASTVSQVKALPEVLKQCGVDLEADADLDLTTAIILPHDSLLLPTVGAIPDSYKHLNVTLGYPLGRTPIAIMIARWAELLHDHKGSYRVDALLSLFGMQVLVERFPSLQRLAEVVRRQRSFRLSARWLHERYAEVQTEQGGDIKLGTEPMLEGYDHILDLLIPCSMGAVGFLCALRVLLSTILSSSRLVQVVQVDASEEVAQDAASQQEEPSLELSVFDAEFIHHYILLVNRLQSLIEEYELRDMDLSTTTKLLEGLSQGFTIPFEGNPLQGLQIMGLLESRALHFKKLIYLSAQEGLLPSDKHTTTLIPYALRVGYRLPTPEWQEAADSYRFYQTISSAEQLVMLYGKEDATGGKGEESRYLLQLEYLYGGAGAEDVVSVVRRTAQARPPRTISKPIVVDKRDEVVQAQLARYFSRDKDAKALSASRLSTYISCPLRFYYEAVMEIYDEQTPQELMADNDFGIILHHTMEQLYAPYAGGKIVRKVDLARLLERGNTTIERLIQTNYSRQYGRSPSHTLSTLDRLYCNMIDTYVRGVLEYDLRSPDEFAYLAGEERFEGHIELSDGRLVNIKGDIDRVDILYPGGDERAPSLRLLDYKTGTDSLDKIFAWTQLIKETKYKAQMQLLLYCELVYSGRAKHNILTDAQRAYPILPGAMLVRKIPHNPEVYNPYLSYGAKRQPEIPVDSYQACREDFLAVIKELLDELFDLSVPFTQAETNKDCGYCPFALSCGR